MRSIKSSNLNDFLPQQANRWADQAQRDRISLYGELEMRSRLFQKHHARDSREIEESRRTCCEEADRARQARIDELSMHQERSVTIVSQLLTLMKASQKKVNSLSDARVLYDPESGSSSGVNSRSQSVLYYSESQNDASPRFWIAA